MQFNFLTNNNKEKKETPDELLQITALAYLQDALAQERYEECAFLIKEAKRYGAQGRAIQQLIAEGARRARYGRPDLPVRKPTKARRF